VNDERLLRFLGEANLCGKHLALHVAWRVVVVIVESTLADGHGTGIEMRTNARQVTTEVELRGIVRVHPRRMPDEAGVSLGDPACPVGRVR
jgi:hypothetical protein